MFNLQSGRHRQSFPATLASRRQVRGNSKDNSNVSATGIRHTKAVTGIVVDGLNQTVISCGLDGKIKVGIFSFLFWCGHDVNVFR